MDGLARGPAWAQGLREGGACSQLTGRDRPAVQHDIAWHQGLHEGGACSQRWAVLTCGPAQS
eukprot:6724312-Lingulodinium_polyedra.AAC.1